jgi:phosphoglycolate phosphatase
MRLVLFDIDGTLIRGVRQHLNSFVYSWRKVYRVSDLDFDPQDAPEWFAHDGKPDSQITFDVMRRHNIKDPLKRMRACNRVMGEFYRKNVHKEHLVLIPGARKAIVALHKKGFCLGLVTGNLEAIARCKLSRFSLNSYFPAGGFGEDALTRKGLIPLAVKRLEKKFLVKFADKDIFLIGDTPRDIAAAKANNVRCISVASGRFSRQRLKNRHPFAILPDLIDSKKLLRIIEDG